ncbi:hypothetical protein [Zooshikella sp. RANM57]|uniref:hypothetical protein n=1 Tax=Zooshikella sp. RANM57 TaxID=3425863 RepID=UPI003D6F4BED
MEKLMTRARHTEKNHLVLWWLCQFGFSDRFTLSKALKVNHLGQGYYFSKLEKELIIEAIDQKILPRKLYRLGSNGAKLAEYLFPPTDTKRIYNVAYSTYLHESRVQGVAAAFDEPLQVKNAKKYLHGKNIKIPDLLVGKNAYEIEVTRKSSKWIFNAYLSHLQNIKKGHYQRVIYLFQHAVMRDTYEKLFHRARWPYYQSKGNSLVKTDATFEASAIHGRNFFQFGLIEDYL